MSSKIGAHTRSDKLDDRRCLLWLYQAANRPEVQTAVKGILLSMPRLARTPERESKSAAFTTLRLSIPIVRREACALSLTFLSTPPGSVSPQPAVPPPPGPVSPQPAVPPQPGPVAPRAAVPPHSQTRVTTAGRAAPTARAVAPHTAVPPVARARVTTAGRENTDFVRDTTPGREHSSDSVASQIRRYWKALGLHRAHTARRVAHDTGWSTSYVP